MADKEHLIIDRIEGETALCETADRTIIAIPLSLLPPGAGEGAVLTVTEQGYALDAAEAERRRAAAKALLRKLKGKKEQQQP